MDESILSILLAPAVMLAAVIGVLGLFAIAVILRQRKKRIRRRLERRRQQETQREQNERNASAARKPSLRTYAMPVVDVSEKRVFAQIEEVALRGAAGHRVLPQVALSAFLYNGMKGLSRSDEIEAAILMSSRQVDFLVVDDAWQPVVAVSLERDSLSAGEDDGVEADACANAGILFLMASPRGLSPAQLDEIRRHVGDPQVIAAQ
ncbi:DUF2726 domain-containing protein [Roseibacterium sp. SDUM158017]|uniref:DUF2726 domain-containing protein n=1 Tax=Roseicyclus salinarum TaxID=3036773 RepID=UPI0024154086|nr:DUF2726 domain-containing protein [Roseibacterium sp. SDUM158017]MDG4648332.1 DUF2726 domain-containing protein [Roseibacterium sp. SDUM158017]